MKKNVSKHLVEFCVEKCHVHGLKVTPQRSAIYEELMNAKDHPSADQVYRRVKKHFPHISFDTVNRTLMTFVEIGLLDPVAGYGRSRRFDSCLESHHHVHCVRCGKIVDFKSRSYDTLKVPQEISNKFIVLNKKVVVNVICDTCKKETSYV